MTNEKIDKKGAVVISILLILLWLKSNIVRNKEGVKFPVEQKVCEKTSLFFSRWVDLKNKNLEVRTLGSFFQIYKILWNRKSNSKIEKMTFENESQNETLKTKERE